MPLIATHTLRSFVTQPFAGATAFADQTAWPKLTVVTPSYNQAAYLERTILSVLNQQYPNLEYFVIDGGSTDGSVAIIEKYAPYLAGWVSEKDRGQTDAINKGFRRATGDFVAFQNSDDIFAPGALAKAGEAIRQDPKADVLFGDMYIIDGQDVITEELRLPPFCVECQLHEGMQVFNQSLFIRRERLEQFGLLDETLRFAIDYEIITRLSVQPGVRFRYVDGFWGGFRLQPDAKTSVMSHVGMAEHAQIRAKFLPDHERQGQKQPVWMKSVLGQRFWHRYCRVRKLLYFAGRGELRYMLHRLGLRNKPKTT